MPPIRTLATFDGDFDKDAWQVYWENGFEIQIGPGRDVCKVLIEVLNAMGVSTGRIEPHEFYGQCFDAFVGRQPVWFMVQCADIWYLNCDNLGRVAGWFGGRSAFEPLLVQLNAALRKDGRLRNILWYDQKAYGRRGVTPGYPEPVNDPSQYLEADLGSFGPPPAPRGKRPPVWMPKQDAEEGLRTVATFRFDGRRHKGPRDWKAEEVCRELNKVMWDGAMKPTAYRRHKNGYAYYVTLGDRRFRLFFQFYRRAVLLIEEKGSWHDWRQPDALALGQVARAVNGVLTAEKRISDSRWFTPSGYMAQLGGDKSPGAQAP